jgi:hypothetical protein
MPMPVRIRERGRALIQGAQGAKGSGISRRRAPGANSLSVLRVRSSMCFGRSRFDRFPHFQPAPTYKVPQDGPPNEYSLMLIPRGSMAPRGRYSTSQNNGRKATPADFLIKTIIYHPLSPIQGVLLRRDGSLQALLRCRWGCERRRHENVARDRSDRRRLRLKLRQQGEVPLQLALCRQQRNVPAPAQRHNQVHAGEK